MHKFLDLPVKRHYDHSASCVTLLSKYDTCTGRALMGSDSVALICGLASAASFGTADFCGGVATKRNNVFTVILISQVFGLALLVTLAIFLREPLPSADAMALGGLAGIAGALGLAALYRGLATGRMGVVAPISAVTAAVFPILVSMIMEGMPSHFQMAGLGVGIVAIWYLPERGGGASVRRRDMMLPVGAGLAFGLFFILIDQVSSKAILWPLVSARIVSITLLSALITIRRDSIKPVMNQLAVIAATGIFDAGGNILFAVATRLGRLDISATVASLYPAGTVILAWIILNEKLSSRQWFGVLTALAALTLIAWR